MPAVRLSLLAVLLLCGQVRAADSKPPEGFKPLFNGKDLVGWGGLPHRDPAEFDTISLITPFKRWTEEAKKHWKADSGELICGGGEILLATGLGYGDVEFRAEAKGDTGLVFRGSPVWRLPQGGKEWRSLRLVQVGERTTLHVDGKLLIDNFRRANAWSSNLPLRGRGPIELQPGKDARWRNLFVREIPPAEANKILQKRHAAGFKDVFNGKDFTGWAGPVDNYEVKDGAIVCRPKKGGNIYTKEQYGDFVARVEFRLPPGGNNGLAIRYPGKGQASVDAMCEVQVLDDTAPKYAKLDPRQFNGSVYGMVAAHRGYLRPVGDWNFMEVTVRGPTIVVELNGTRILDGDVSKVTEFMDNKRHPGKDRLSGHFGFCGHSDPVAFRNIQIKPLPPVKNDKP